MLKACAGEYLNINKADYDKEIENQGLELFLVDLTGWKSCGENTCGLSIAHSEMVNIAFSK